jgi:hypothetical protein
MERHRGDRAGWLRAAVLGANDGILSTASLMLGVAASHAAHGNIMVAGVAGLVAGSMSMAAGEYVSVHSQADIEKADLTLERAELKTDNEGEQRELAAIYVKRGLDPALATKVAEQLMAHDALGAHAQDELGISTASKCTPDPGGTHFGCQFRGRCAHAPDGYCPGTGGGPDSHYRGDFPALPGVSGRAGSTRRGRRIDGGGDARHVLGSSGYGADRRRRSALWNHCGRVITSRLSRMQ